MGNELDHYVIMNFRRIVTWYKQTGRVKIIPKKGLPVDMAGVMYVAHDLPHQHASRSAYTTMGKRITIIDPRIQQWENT